MKRARIGALRHRLVIEAAQRTSDGGGGVSESWQAVATVWGAINPLDGSETVAGEGLAGRLTHAITIRHRAGLAPAMRLRFGARLFEIAAVVDVDERRRQLRCLCRERDL